MASPLLLLLLLLPLLVAAPFLVAGAHPPPALRLVHRFSDEARAAAGSGGRPSRGRPEYYETLRRSDVQRQRATYERLFPSEGSQTVFLGDDFGWLHYTWIDIGTPNISFLVALDTGSDLFWVPCDCIQCASLSGAIGSLDKDFGMYSPAGSRTSRHLSCNHELCVLDTSCKSPKQLCPYTVNYYSDNTSSSGLLVEDTLYLASGDGHEYIQAPVIIGCGRRQSGGYLDGIARDGLLGLGFGNISVPSILARAGLVHNSFSMCFQDDDVGRIFFGDQGSSTQQSTPFVALDGKYVTYIVEVESFCIENQCVGKTSFQALVDSGSSFTYLPDDLYKKVIHEFDKQVNASRLGSDESAEGFYCYRASPLVMPNVPSVSMVLAGNKSFVATTPTFMLHGKEEELTVFCLGLQPSEESLATIGQNFMTGYLMVFDRENLRLRWSKSNCRDLDNSQRVPLTPPQRNGTENPLPTDEQQNPPKGGAVSPAVAGRAPATIPSAASPQAVQFTSFLLLLTHATVILIG